MNNMILISYNVIFVLSKETNCSQEKHTQPHHKHHKKKRDRSTEHVDNKCDNATRKYNHENFYSSQITNKDSDLREKHRHNIEYSSDKVGYGRHEKYSRYENERYDSHSRSKTRYESLPTQDRDRRRQQKSEELLENKRKDRPMSPPKEVYHSDRRRYSTNDTCKVHKFY